DMKRSASAISKQGRKLAGKPNGSATAGAGQEADIKDTMGVANSPWANATIDGWAVLHSMGYAKGVPGIISDNYIFRSLTPEDTPESAKDSEPNSDVSPGNALDLDANWSNLGTDLLLDLNNPTLDQFSTDGDTLNPSFLVNEPASLPDWDDVQVDFS